MSRPLRAIKFMWNNYSLRNKPIKPPYQHVCQIGDPILRTPSELVKPELIKTNDIQNVIRLVIDTMKLYNACGLSAPQIGIPLQIFAAQLTESQVRLSGPTRRKAHNIQAFPLKVFINPEMEIIDDTKLNAVESCVSTALFEAQVPRYKEVLVTGLNASGEPHSWQAKDWCARIVQHEMDHLKGDLFTDKMDPRTLTMAYWEEVNRKRGRVKLSLTP